jgi:hypothetical protein
MPYRNLFMLAFCRSRRRSHPEPTPSVRGERRGTGNLIDRTDQDFAGQTAASATLLRAGGPEAINRLKHRRGTRSLHEIMFDDGDTK